MTITVSVHYYSLVETHRGPPAGPQWVRHEGPSRVSLWILTISEDNLKNVCAVDYGAPFLFTFHSLVVTIHGEVCEKQELWPLCWWVPRWGHDRAGGGPHRGTAGGPRCISTSVGPAKI